MRSNRSNKMISAPDYDWTQDYEYNTTPIFTRTTITKKDNWIKAFDLIKDQYELDIIVDAILEKLSNRRTDLNLILTLEKLRSNTSNTSNDRVSPLRRQQNIRLSPTKRTRFIQG